MPDITMCTTDDCPLRSKCYRYSAEPDEAQAFKKFHFVTRHNNVSCDKIIPIEKLDTLTTNVAQKVDAQPFNDALVTQLSGVQMTKKKRHRSSKTEIQERVAIARDMLEDGKSNVDIYRATKDQTGFPIGVNMLCDIRAGRYVGWGAELLKPKALMTSDVPPPRVQILADKVVQGVTLQQALRLVTAAMREEKIAKLSIYEDGRVKASVQQIKEWTVD